MKTKNLIRLSFGLLFTTALFSCSTNDDLLVLKEEVKDLKEEIKKNQDVQKPFLKLTMPEGQTDVPFYPGETKIVKVEADGIKDIEIDGQLPRGWSVKFNAENNELTVTAPLWLIDNTNKISISGVNADGLVYKANLICSGKTIDYLNQHGVYILNEGSVWSKPIEYGSLIFITPEKHAIPMVYSMNNDRPLGHGSQDMAVKDGLFYIISQNQNPDTDGILTIIDGNTMKKTANFSAELSDLSWPTHVAVLDDHNIFIRDNHGISRFDRTTKKLSFVEGTNGARKNTMLSLDNKVFASKGNSLLVLSAGANKVTQIVKFEHEISGIVQADQKSLYISTQGNQSGKEIAVIYQINTTDYKTIKKNIINDNENSLIAASYAATPSITAKGDTIYYSGMGSSIYRHIFSSGTTKKMTDTKSINPMHTVTYNTVTVHPITGHVYLNTLLGFGQSYKTNTIYEFDMTGVEGKLVHRYDNYTRFPAGIFFPSRK